MENPKSAMVVYDVPEELKHQFIGSGCSGDCYLAENGYQVYKELFNTKLDKAAMKAFTYIDNDSIMFPRTIVYKDSIQDDNIMGYICDYVDGKSFEQIPDDESIHTFIDASDKLEKSMKDASEKGVLVDDINPNNILYTSDKEFKLIDTDFYEYQPYEESYLLYKGSLREWGNFLMTYFGKGFPFKNNNINEYYIRLVFYGKLKPSYLINYMMHEINRELGHEIQTIGEYKESQQLIKKLK